MSSLNLSSLNNLLSHHTSLLNSESLLEKARIKQRGGDKNMEKGGRNTEIFVCICSAFKQIAEIDTNLLYDFQNHGELHQLCFSTMDRD